MKKPRRLCGILAAVLLLLVLLPAGAPAASAATPVYRALCISEGNYMYDNPLSQFADNNASAISSAFKRDSRYKEIYAYRDLYKNSYIPGDALMASSTGFLELIGKAFAKATAEDVSVFYFSGHGMLSYDAGDPNTSLVLIDGTLISAKALREAMDKIAGKKVLLLDICYSGNLIAKSGADFHAAFAREFSKASKSAEFVDSNYYVLTASSGAEQSWNTASNGDWGANPNRPMGMFTRVLAQGLGDAEAGGRVMADENINGNVTLKEMQAWLARNSFMSKAQLYPQDSNLSLFKYTVKDSNRPLITDAQITPMASAGNYKLTLKLGARANVNVQVIAIQYFPEKNNTMSFTYIKHSISGGYKSQSAGTRSYTWNGKADYSHINGDYYFVVREKNTTAWYLYPFVYNNTRPTLKLSADGAFSHGQKSEAAIEVSFSADCALNVNIYNSAGKKVRVLAKNDRVFPYGHMEIDGPYNMHTYYWNGRDDAGERVPAGTYTVRVQGSYNKGTTKVHSAKIKVTK